ncbi:hypothetical protein V513_09360 [Mesotoga sp. H07.pep.5.3]|nr:hypothetical protein V513_09360 [Mesotoga sp. H07.pep.5.3]
MLLEDWVKLLLFAPDQPPTSDPQPRFLQNQIPKQVRDDPEQKHFRAGSVRGKLTVIARRLYFVIPTKLLVGILMLLIKAPLGERRTVQR